MLNTTQEVTEAEQFLLDTSITTIKKIQAGFVEANKNYIKNSLLCIVYNAIDNFPIFDETQQQNIIELKRELLYGRESC